MPELPTPFRKGKSGEFEIPKRSLGYESHPMKYRETGKLNVKSTAKGFAKSFGLFAGVEALAATGGPADVLIAAPFAMELFKPHAVYEARKKKVSEVI